MYLWIFFGSIFNISLFKTAKTLKKSRKHNMLWIFERQNSPDFKDFYDHKLYDNICDTQGKYFSGIPDHLPWGYSSGTLYESTSGHLEVLWNKFESPDFPDFKLFMSFSRFRLFLEKYVIFKGFISFWLKKVAKIWNSFLMRGRSALIPQSTLRVKVLSFKCMHRIKV
jgi:hypothetical protein